MMKNKSCKWIANYAVLINVCMAQAMFSQNYTKTDAHTRRVIDSTYNALLKKYKVVGASIAIVDNGEIVYATGYGFSDREKKVKADEKTIFRIGSSTKSFTALSIMQLQEKGLLNINNSIKKYITDLKIPSRFNDHNPIFIKDVLCHCSGLPCDISNGFFCDNPPSITWEINELNKQTTISPRLYMRAYSNVGYGLLGEVVARVSGTSYSSYVRDHIFEPLHMASSYIENDEKLSVNFSKGYLKDKEIKEPLIRDQAAGLIHSNAIDMANYVNMYLNNGMSDARQIVSPGAIREMEKNRMDSVLLSSDSDWGYGLYTEKASVKKDKDSMLVNIIGHGGDTYAFHADFAYIPELNIGVVILTNTDNGNWINSAKKLLRIYLKEAKSKTIKFNPKELEKPVSIAAAMEKECTQEEIIGRYNFGNLMIDVKNAKKIKFKQGPATIKLIQKKGQPNTYSLKASLYKVIPIKIKGAAVKFVKLNDAIYFKQIDTKTNEEMYIAIKSEPIIIPGNWKAKYGKYNIVNSYYKCTSCPYGNAEGMSLSIAEDNGFIVIKTKGKTPDTNNKVFLTIISDDMAVTGGIERGTGETIRILENGNIYYSGFEFSKSN